ncbi:MAG: flagellar hook-basal body complex protein [Candidatus Margulisiibacteriota bacterium]
MPDSILEIGKSALETSEMKAKMLMNNVANAQTPGYRKSDVITSSFPLALENATRSVEAPKVIGAYNNLQYGAMFKTGASTDLAIGGDGYFVVQSNEGEFYTRDGRFYIDSEGNLLTSSGNFPVMGQAGPISISRGSKLEISKTGAVIVDNVQTDQVRVVKFDKPSSLVSVNNSLFKSPPEGLSYQEDTSPNIAQGFLESSNVSVINEMTNIITTQRSYELAAKIIKDREADMQKMIEIGKPAQ